MMKYSIGGYIVALRARSRHTICGEGKTDVLAIKHCLLKVCNNNDSLHGKYVVDSMEMIESDGTSYANVDKLKKIHSLTVQNGLSSKFTALVDREYSCFNLTLPKIDMREGHYIEEGNLFYTRGHSIENYFFLDHLITDYLEFNHATALTADYKTKLLENWADILCLTAALTIGIWENRLINKCKDLFTFRNWKILDDGHIVMDDESIVSSMRMRGIDQTSAFSVLTRAKSIGGLLEGNLPICRWIIHGHIGMDLIFGAVGNIIFNSGANEDICLKLNGNSDVKFKYLVDKWYLNYSADTNSFPIKFFERIIEQLSNTEA